jgi:hypothetical protein
MFKMTDQMCMITVEDESREDGIRHVDLGNYYLDTYNNKVLITSKENAIKYSKLIKVPVYCRRESI